MRMQEKMAFQRDKAAQDDHDDDERQDAVAEGAHFITSGRDHGGEGHDNGDLCKFGGLEADARDLDPALGAVGRGADDRHEHEEKHRDQQDDERGAAPELIVQAADKQHAADTGDGKDRLPGEVIGRIAFQIIRAGVGGREDHDNTDQHEQDRQRQERQIEQAALVKQHLVLCFVRLRQPLRSPALREIIQPCDTVRRLAIGGRSFPGKPGSIPVHNAEIRQHAHDKGDGGEDEDDLLLFPAAQFEVVVDRSHFEDALAMGQLEIGDLQNDGKRLTEIDDADENQESAAYRAQRPCRRPYRRGTANRCHP